MVDRDQDGNVKKGWEQRLDELLDKVPGLKDFRGREKMRDRDKLLRTYTSDQINSIKGDIDNLKQELLSQGSLSLLSKLEQLTSKLDRARDTHKFDSYGYSGVFDANAVKEDALEKLYDYDLKILDEVKNSKDLISGCAANVSEDSVSESLPTLKSTVESLLNLVLERKNVLTDIA